MVVQKGNSLDLLHGALDFPLKKGALDFPLKKGGKRVVIKNTSSV